ncbi:hypothetical protein FRX31_005012 [Thalictrum thalictroides]|uniref:ZZ-type domain-containing protein n=1 Tax=Thalictrum thalictroides TaxID=46969 RepID=A0A7J6X6L6_THATH|nr:hypothetical protein FRX31_005012 [Thalictrum thalictroides]
MEDCEAWELPILNGVDFFPNLIQLEVSIFGGVLPALGKLKSLENLVLVGMQGLKHLFDELFGIPTTASDIVVYPALKSLDWGFMRSWEEKAVFMRKEGEEEEGCNTYNGITIMPRLSKLHIVYCLELKVIPFYMFSHELKDLRILDCPQLIGLQPSLPPLLEKLTLVKDVGVLKTSLPLLLHNNNYPNLHCFEIYESSQSSLPQGFNQLTSIRQLKFQDCEVLNFGPDDLKHLTMLEELKIIDCPILAERFIGGGEISSSSSHIYNISIEPDPINVHTGIQCDNCKMDPIVGKRYKCKDCYDEGVVSDGNGFDLCEKCYNTPSKHTYLVNQHHRKGHTFELIANRGDIPVPVHPDDASEEAKGGLVVAKSADIEEKIKLAQV